MNKETLDALTSTMKTLGGVIIASVISAVICIWFGYSLGHSKSSNSLSSSSKYLEDDWFVSDGEEIEDDDSEYTWLLPAAKNYYEPIKATATTNETWEKSSDGVVRVDLPDEIFLDSETCDIKVYYSRQLKAGEAGTVAVVIETIDEYAYCAFCQFTAKENLQVAYDAQKIAMMADWIQFSFNTSATGKEELGGYVTKTDDYAGTISVRFKDIKDADEINAKDIPTIKKEAAKSATTGNAKSTKKNESVQLVAEKPDDWSVNFETIESFLLKGKEATYAE